MTAHWNCNFFGIFCPKENPFPPYDGCLNLKLLLSLYESYSQDNKDKINSFWYERTRLLQALSGLLDPLGEIGYLNYKDSFQYMISDEVIMNKLIFDIDDLLGEVQAKFSNM